MLFSNPRYDFFNARPGQTLGAESLADRQSLNRSWFVSALCVWLPLAVIITLFCGLVYLVVQQDLRMGANDPQISLAEETAHDISIASSVAAQRSVLGMLQGPLTLDLNGQRTDIAESLEPYVIVYDASGNPVASTAELDGKIPSPPSGVFAYTLANGEDRLTWQPRDGIRQAIVVSSFSGIVPPSAVEMENGLTATTTTVKGVAANSSYLRSGFVLSGRSLNEVENREGKLTINVLIAWIIFMLSSLVAVICCQWFCHSRKSHE
jgi:hypothetical protein